MKKQNYSAIYKIVSGAVIALAPSLVLAATNPAAVSGNCQTVASGGLVGLFRCFSGLVNILIGLMFILATFLFLWGVTKFLSKADDVKSRDEGRSFMIWGIIAMFVMAAAWALAGVIGNTFGFDTGRPEMVELGGGTSGSSASGSGGYASCEASGRVWNLSSGSCE